MTRLLVALALLAWPAVASAQYGGAPNGGSPTPGATVWYGPPTVSGYLVGGFPITNGGSALYPVQMVVPDRFSVGGGSMSAPSQIYIPSGSWGWAYYPWPVQEIYVEYDQRPMPRPAAPARGLSGTPPLGAFGQANATLVMQFPAAAEVWLGGKKADGAPATEWTLSSPTLEKGAAYTFEVKGRWKVGGKTFESSRTVTVAAGDRNRLTVVSGTEIK
jgi:uncharacterized protein (TIGR03000 family)